MEKDGFLRLNNMLFVSNQKIGLKTTNKTNEDLKIGYQVIRLDADKWTGKFNRNDRAKIKSYKNGNYKDYDLKKNSSQIISVIEEGKESGYPDPLISSLGMDRRLNDIENNFVKLILLKDYTRDKLFAYKIYYLRADNGMIHLIGKQVEPSVSSEISEILHERRGEVYNKLISEAFKDCKAEGENPQN